MVNFSRNFVLGKMNKVVDERLVPNGEYIDALNVRMGSTEGSEIEQTLYESGGGICAYAIKDGEFQTRSYPASFGGDYATS